MTQRDAHYINTDNLRHPNINVCTTKKKTLFLGIVNRKAILYFPKKKNPHKQLYLYFQHEHSI